MARGGHAHTVLSLNTAGLVCMADRVARGCHINMHGSGGRPDRNLNMKCVPVATAVLYFRLLLHDQKNLEPDWIMKSEPTYADLDHLGIMTMHEIDFRLV